MVKHHNNQHNVFHSKSFIKNDENYKEFYVHIPKSKPEKGLYTF